MKPGQYVRLRVPAGDFGSKARPKKVTAVYPNGMIQIEGSEGYFKAFLFAVVEIRLDAEDKPGIKG